jgi:hypothetical protein
VIDDRWTLIAKFGSELCRWTSSMELAAKIDLMRSKVHLPPRRASSPRVSWKLGPQAVDRNHGA